MLNKEAQDLVKQLNTFQKQDKKLTDSLTKFVEKYFNDNTSIEELAAIYSAVWTKSISYLTFRITDYMFHRDMKRGKILLHERRKDYQKYLPKGFQIKRVKKLTATIDELDLKINETQHLFWTQHCIPIINLRDQEVIYDLISDIHGEGLQLVKFKLWDICYELKNKNENEIKKIIQQL